MPRRLLAPLLLTLSLLAAACAAPAPEATSPRAELAPATSTPVVDQAPPRTAPPMSRPLPPEQVATPVALDRSCRTDADCAVKNVGNCCGAMPACVNRNSPTDPAAVQAECARKGIVSACGFQPVDSCSCTAGTCTDNRALIQ